MTKAVFPPTTNHHNTLFGGTALAWMDEVSFITATRFCRLPLVTVSTDRIDFNHPIPAGSIVELVGRVVKVGNTSLKVEVEVYLESMYADGREKAIHGLFSFVAIDDEKRPVPVLPGFPPARRLDTGRKKAPTGAFSISPDDPALGWDQGRRLIFREAWDRSICCRLTLPNVCSRGAPAMRILSKRTSPILLGRRRLTEPSGLSVLCVLPVS